MIVAATVVGQPPCEKNSATGTHISTNVLKWAKIRDNRPGRRSSGNFSKNSRLMNRGRNSGLLDIIVDITNGKCLLSFEVAAPIQITRNTSLAATIDVDTAEQERHRQRRVDLAAGGQEDHLVAQRQDREDHENHPDPPHRQQPDRGAQLRHRAGAIGEQAFRTSSAAALHTAPHPPGCGHCPWSTGRDPATVAAGWCRAAASTGSSPSAGETGCSTARSRSPARPPRTTSCRARPSRTRLARRTSARRRWRRPSRRWSPRKTARRPGCTAES